MRVRIKARFAGNGRYLGQKRNTESRSHSGSGPRHKHCGVGWKTDQDKTYPAKMPSEWVQLHISQLIFNHWQSAFVQHAG